MSQMHDGCLSEVKTIGELLLGWPKGGSFYVVFVAGDLFWQFSEGCVYSWKYNTLFSFI